MLTLYTGTPGSGKTALVVAELERFLRAQPGRPVFVMGIPELKLPHVECPPVEQWTVLKPTPEDPTLLESEFTFPDGALVIIDEAQKVFRPRGVGSKVPEHVAAFEKHRHKGLDFWLVSQHPNLLDPAVRKLIGRHVHLRSHWAGRELIEWPEAADPTSRAERASGVRQRYTLPKHVFGLYRSASLHVKPVRRIPRLLYVLFVLVAIGGYMAWNVGSKLWGAFDDAPELVERAGEGAEVVNGGAAPLTPRASGGGEVAGRGISLADFEPRLRGRPETAPLYDGIRQVVAVPLVAGCVALGERCTCYTEQGSDAGYSPEECKAWLAKTPFQPFRAVLPPPVARAKAEASAADHAALALR